MSSTSVAHGVPNAVRERIERGITLYRNHAAEIARTGEGTYRVPGSNGESYTVDIERGYCSCRDHSKRGHTCKHVYCCELLAAHEEGCRRRKTARPKRIRHEHNPLWGAADLDRLDEAAERLGMA